MYSDEDKLNNEQVKEVVKQLIIRTKGYINVDKNDNFYSNIQRTASELGYIEEPEYTQRILSYNDTSKCIEKIWEYVLSGVLAPGSPSSGYNIFFPYLHLTNYGKKVMEENVNPYSADDYINNIRNISGDLFDAVSELYLFESLKSFQFNCYLAAMILLGGFSEKIFLNFLDEFKSCVQDQTKKNKIDKQKFISGKFNEFLKIIKPLKNQLSDDVKHNLELWLSSFFNYVRITRNEVGHPTGKEMSREEIYAMLLIFPSYLKNLIELLNHFKSNPIN